MDVMEEKNILSKRPSNIGTSLKCRTFCFLVSFLKWKSMQNSHLFSIGLLTSLKILIRAGKCPKDEGNKGRHQSNGREKILIQQYMETCNQQAKHVHTWEKLNYLLFAAAERKASKPDESVPCCFLAVWTRMLHDPVHLNVVGLENCTAVTIIRHCVVKLNWIKT